MKFLKKFSSQQEKDNFDATTQNVKYISLIDNVVTPTSMSGLYFDWIQNDGQSYIDTDIVADDNTKIEIKVWTDNVGSFYLCGSRTSAAGSIIYGISGSQNDKKVLFSVNGTQTNSTIVRDSSGQTIYCELETNGNGTYSGYVKNEDSGEEFTASNVAYTSISSNDLHIFLFSNGYNTISPTVKIYYVKIYKNGELVGYFKPYKKFSDSSVGMINVVDGKIYTNNGQGSLTLGNN